MIADDFGLVGSELLGGSSLPMSAEKRQQLMHGIQVRAKFVGTIEVPEPRGMAMAITAIGRVRVGWEQPCVGLVVTAPLFPDPQAHHKQTKEQKPKVIFDISVSGIKIFDAEDGSLRDSYALDKIAFVTALPKDKKVFCFISVNDTVQPMIYKCHVFKSSTKAFLISDAMGQCFTLALELRRQRAPAGSHLNVSPDSPHSRAAASVRGAGRPANASFEAIIAAMRASIARLTLQRLYDQACVPAGQPRPSTPSNSIAARSDRPVPSPTPPHHYDNAGDHRPDRHDLQHSRPPPPPVARPGYPRGSLRADARVAAPLGTTLPLSNGGGGGGDKGPSTSRNPFEDDAVWDTNPVFVAPLAVGLPVGRGPSSTTTASTTATPRAGSRL